MPKKDFEHIDDAKRFEEESKLKKLFYSAMEKYFSSENEVFKKSLRANKKTYKKTFKKLMKRLKQDSKSLGTYCASGEIDIKFKQK